MPTVNGKKFPYTSSGVAAAGKAAAKASPRALGAITDKELGTLKKTMPLQKMPAMRQMPSSDGMLRVKKTRKPIIQEI